jgi:hypothetical protein
MKSTRRRILAGLAALLVMGWLAAIVSAYDVRHKPFDPAFALGIGRAALDVLLAAVIIAVAGGVGRRIVAAPHPDPLASLALQASLGLGICALGALAAGLAGLYDPWVGWAAVAVLLILLRRSIRAWLAAWREAGASLRQGGRSARVLAALTAGFSLLFPDDEASLTHQLSVFDVPYTWCRLQEAWAKT